MTEEKIIYKIVDSNTGNFAGAYSRACHTEYEFDSVSDARAISKNKSKYKIQKWKVTYELIEEDCDPVTGDEKKDTEYYDPVLTSLVNDYFQWALDPKENKKCFMEEMEDEFKRRQGNATL